jgi:hypothetical protein
MALAVSGLVTYYNNAHDHRNLQNEARIRSRHVTVFQALTYKGTQLGIFFLAAVAV